MIMAIIIMIITKILIMIILTFHLPAFKAKYSTKK